MKITQIFKGCVTAVAAAGMLIPSVVRAETITAQPQQVRQQATVLDVELHTGGKLVGQVVTAQAAPVADELVVLRQGGKEVARTRTDKLGRYEFRTLRGGVYTVITEKGGANYRVWSENTAPPSAQTAAMMVVGDVVRGQPGHHGGGVLLDCCSNPWILGAAAAVGIGLPLALDDDDGPAS